MAPWIVPVAMFAKNKMDEGRAKEESRKQQLYNLRMQQAKEWGAPTYGAQVAKGNYDTERQIEEERRRSNARIMQALMKNMGKEEEADGFGSVFE